MPSLIEHLDAIAATSIDRCTRCGKCVEVCPVVPVVNLGSYDPPAVVDGVMRLSRGQPSSPESMQWTEACNGSGECIEACPEGINVRQWLSIAKLKLRASVSEGDRAASARERFRAMAQAVRLLASMQVPTPDLGRILAPAGARKADLVFYYGCNVLRSPHIIFNVMDILEAIGLDFEVLGGTASCCGVVQFMAGDLGTYERIAGSTFGAFASLGAKTVVTWCPTCQLQFGEIQQPVAKPAFAIEHVTEFLTHHVERIRSRVVRGMKRRAVIHEHGGVRGVVESTRRLMGLVPDLEIVDVPQNREFGYQCSRVVQYPEQQTEVHRTIAENAKAAGVDLLITIYHGCHRQLAGAEGQYPYEVKNFTDVLAEALGRGRRDLYKQYKKDGDIEEAIRSGAEFLRQNGVNVDRHVEFLANEIFGEPGIAGRMPDSSQTLTFST